MIIEAHSHIQPATDFEKMSHSSYGVPVDGIDSYRRAYTENGVSACFVFMSEGFRLESRIPYYNEALAKLRDDNPDFLIPWASVSPYWPETKLRAEIRRAIKELGLHGLKFVPIIQGFPISGQGMDIVAEEAIDLNIPVTFHDGSPEYCSAIQIAYFARKYPKLRVLSAHAGLRELWPDFIDAVKELPNLWLCLSGPGQLGIQTLYNELGPDRLLFGSDGGLGHSAVITAYLRRIRALDAPEEDKKKILGINALKFLNLDPARFLRKEFDCGIDAALL